MASDTPVTTRVYIDGVATGGTYRIVALPGRFVNPQSPPVESMPDPRHASADFCVHMVERLVPMEVHAWDTDVDPQVETLFERVVSMLEWCWFDAATRGVVLDSVYTALRVGIIGDGDRAAARVRLPGPAELQAVVGRLRDHGRRLGLVTPAQPPGVSVLPFGVVSAPPALTAARYLCTASCLGDRGPIAGISLHGAPSSEACRHIGQSIRAAFHAPPDVMAMAAGKVRLARHDAGTDMAAAEAVGRLLNHVCATEMRNRAPVKWRRLVLRATAEARAELTQRHGDYEACEEVLRRICAAARDGDAPLVARALAGEPFELARVWLTRAAVANHRGDVDSAQEALAHTFEALDAERSIRSGLLRMEGATLRVVAMQNCGPWEPSRVGERERLEHAVRKLRGEAEKMRGLMSAMGRPVADPVLGAALGTLGRSEAFLGNHDVAESDLLAARAMFTAESDLRMNAHMLCLVQLDRPEAPDPQRVAEYLDMVVVRGARSPRAFAQALQDGDEGVRFTGDLLLRGMMAGVEIDGCDVQVWVAALGQRGESSLLAALSVRRSHPSELFSRHAAELLAGCGMVEEARAWFRLSMAISSEGGASMGRLGRFTERLSRGLGPDSAAPAGTIDNPGFEYR